MVSVVFPLNSLGLLAIKPSLKNTILAPPHLFRSLRYQYPLITENFQLWIKIRKI